MAETRAVGNDGNITLPTGHVAVIRSWTGSITQVVTETTGFVDTFRRYRGGVMGMEWTATGGPKFGAASMLPLPESTTDVVGMDVDGATITLTVATATSYSGTGIVRQMDISSDKLGEAALTYSGVIDNTITQTWAEA